jgi:protein farnesyltransferase subunit beta
VSSAIKGFRRHKVRFSEGMEALSSQADSAASFSVADDTTPTASGFVIEELTSSEIDADEDMWEDVDTGSGNGTAKPQSYGPIVPGLYTSWPPLSDLHDTETSYAQHDTVLEVLPFLSGTTDAWPRESYSKQGVPRLRRAEHIRFLHKSLGPLPAPYAASDAARPWFFYWSLCALRTLGEDISQYRDRMVSTVRPMQNSTGGFGGGHGQMSHLATTYAIVLSLAMVGGEEAYEIVDRRSMWRWLGSLKQADGGFRVAIGGEEDVR